MSQSIQIVPRQETMLSQDEFIINRLFKIIVFDVATVATLTYYSGDPYAVAVKVYGPPEPVVWAFARDLLKEGGGDGDINIQHGEDKTVVKLCNPSGEAALFFPKQEVDEFVDAVYALVPADEESDHVDWEKEMSVILRQE